MNPVRKKMLGKDFFARSGPQVAKELLGKFLVRKTGSKEIALQITEVESYHGWSDAASHARAGKTLRNAAMFEEPGTIYIFFTYGMHYMLNISTGKKDFPSAVLIRAAGKVIGPARLTKALRIDKKLNGKELSKKTGLWIEDRGFHVPSASIRKTPRIGVDYAGVWAKKPWRFILN